MKLAAGDGKKYVVHVWHGTIAVIHQSPCAKSNVVEMPMIEVVPPCGTTSAATGLTLCSDKDTFRRDTGAKLALARALKSLGMSRAVRNALWDDYLLKMGMTAYTTAARQTRRTRRRDAAPRLPRPVVQAAPKR